MANDIKITLLVPSSNVDGIQLLPLRIVETVHVLLEAYGAHGFSVHPVYDQGLLTSRAGGTVHEITIWVPAYHRLASAVPDCARRLANSLQVETVMYATQKAHYGFSRAD